MSKLTKEQIWSRMHALEGLTVCTIQRCEPNLVEQVTESRVRLAKKGKSRPSSPTQTQIWATYDYLWKHGCVTGEDFEKKKIRGNPIERRVSRIISLYSGTPRQSRSSRSS